MTPPNLPEREEQDALKGGLGLIKSAISSKFALAKSLPLGDLEGQVDNGIVVLYCNYDPSQPPPKGRSKTL
jgi:hypothetical protein